jgi:hypothetical protein
MKVETSHAICLTLTPEEVLDVLQEYAIRQLWKQGRIEMNMDKTLILNPKGARQNANLKPDLSFRFSLEVSSEK